ncbi:MAG: GAF domain-containing protein [Phycisphaerae bacterium]|nr:GAF domain-containing protein [Phycisphaerae bacterium]
MAGPRDYSSIVIPRSGTRGERMQSLVDSFWRALSPQGLSWIGFYFGPGGRLDDGRTVGPEEMLLGPCRDKPACSPIGLHGACGQCWRGRESLVVHDVKDLGANYVACDPRDRSEVVVPLFDDSGACYGVLDADSFDVGAFTEHDAIELARILLEAGLTRPRGL